MNIISDICQNSNLQWPAFNSAEMLGSTALALSSILNLYFLLKQALNKEYPKNIKKSTTKLDMCSLKSHTQSLYNSLQSNLNRIGSEFKAEYKHLYEHFSQSLIETQRLVHKNAEQITTLIVQADFHQQRLNDLTEKYDKIFEKFLVKH